MPGSGPLCFVCPSAARSAASCALAPRRIDGSARRWEGQRPAEEGDHHIAQPRTNAIGVIAVIELETVRDMIGIEDGVELDRIGLQPV